jgi:hypothetical protein
MNVDMNEEMFLKLFDAAMEWGEHWQDQAERFENANPGTEYNDPISFAWKYVFWLPSAASMILARSWIMEQGHKCEIVWDMAENPAPQYALLTDYWPVNMKHWSK